MPLSPLRTRPRPHWHWRIRARRVAALGRVGAARGAPRIRALLVRRASRHAGHRQLVAGDPHRAHCLGDVAHPCGIRRHHAAQSCAAAHRRGVSHARDAAPWTHRHRRRARARHRPGHVARDAPVRRRTVPGAASGAHRPVARHAAAGSSLPHGSRHPGRRRAAADLDPRVERRQRPLRRLARRRLFVRASLQPRAARAGGAGLPRELQALGAVS